MTHEVLHYRWFWTLLGLVAAVHRWRGRAGRSRVPGPPGPRRREVIGGMTADLRTGAASGQPAGGSKVVANSTAQLVTFAFRAAAGVGVVVLLARDGGPSPWASCSSH